ncbi:hypothetical protein [Haloarchaeobius sp. HME9146]|uniref:hypothetical protein n=1 Tax=Haloarchaeobius sp. HME9146 TaxID=2978732 RepID=UPI0021BF46C5|nr:hypothetical protein [Haloarchaeobius sp. HME9146]MCT9095272.1 hypothetical protein [Haloarchaeobius sp. HME9146]
MFDNAKRLRKLQKVAQDPTESEHIQALVTVVTEIEDRQISAVEELHDSLGIEGLERTKTTEERRDQLLSLVDVMAKGEFEEWWFGEVIADHLDNPDDARSYAALSDEEWETQKERWADTYRDRAPEEFERCSDEEIAGLHIERKWGVSLSEFEREVVNYSRAEALETVLAGNLQAVEAGVQHATNAVEAGGTE